ncbi:MAG: hypothetical protein JNK87_06435 [Bryobacterales bacterium]|nr:hypothetical protein [Bryobacterales bacterium]
MEYQDYASARYGSKWLLLVGRSIEIARSAALWCGMLLVALLLPTARNDTLVRLLVLVSLGALTALFLAVFFFQHYMAPLLAVWIALGYRGLWTIRRQGAIFAALLLGTLLWSSVLAIRKLRQEAKVVAEARMGREFPFNRHLLQKQLKDFPGGHVVLVRYAPGHSSRYEWVYNLANIDDAPVIWAHDRGIDNARILDRYPGRTFWLIEPDAPLPTPILLRAGSVSRDAYISR